MEMNVQGTLGVMKELKMIEGAPKTCDRYLRIQDYWRVSPRVGGYLEPAVGLDRQFTEVAKDELLEELHSPGIGTLFYSCRSYMVRPGAWAFGVADMEKSDWTPDLAD